MNPKDQPRTVFFVIGQNPITGKTVMFELAEQTAEAAKFKAEELGLKRVVVTLAYRQSEPPAGPPTL